MYNLQLPEIIFETGNIPDNIRIFKPAAPLGDIMGHPGKNNPGSAAHKGSNISKETQLTRKKVSVRIFPT
jgi:hypothetical protein